MSELLIQEESLTKLADAIREQTGSSDSLSFPNGMIESISNIEGLDWLTNLLGGTKVVRSESVTQNNSLIFDSVYSQLKNDLSNLKFAFIISNNYIQGINPTLPEELNNLSPLSLLVYINYNGIKGGFIRLNNDYGSLIRFTNDEQYLFTINQYQMLKLEDCYFYNVRNINYNNSSDLFTEGILTFDSSGYIGYFII